MPDETVADHHTCSKDGYSSRGFIDKGRFRRRETWRNSFAGGLPSQSSSSPPGSRNFWFSARKRVEGSGLVQVISARLGKRPRTLYSRLFKLRPLPSPRRWVSSPLVERDCLCLRIAALGGFDSRLTFAILLPSYRHPSAWSPYAYQRPLPSLDHTYLSTEGSTHCR